MRLPERILEAAKKLIFIGVIIGGRLEASPLFPEPYRDGYVILIWDTGVSDETRTRILRETKEEGITHIAIPVFGCQSTLRSSQVGDCEVHPLRHAFRTAELAVEEGLSFHFIPILTTARWEWRGQIDPMDLNVWFASYGAWIRMLLNEMRTLGMGEMEMTVASEMSELYREDARWKRFMIELRAETTQPLFLTVNWDDLEHDFWSESDAIGVSAYFPLSRWSNPGLDDLGESWMRRKQELLFYSAQMGNKPLYFSEFGYKSATNSARRPWDADGSMTPDPSQQARCFEAFRMAWERERSLVRFMVWGREWPVDPQGVGFDPVGKPAGSILRALFQARSTL